MVSVNFNYEGYPKDQYAAMIMGNSDMKKVKPLCR